MQALDRNGTYATFKKLFIFLSYYIKSSPTLLFISTRMISFDTEKHWINNKGFFLWGKGRLKNNLKLVAVLLNKINFS